MNKYYLWFKCYFKETKLGIFYRRKRDLKPFFSVSEAKRVISEFAPELSRQEKDVVLEDVLKMAQQYHFAFDEYFLYNFKNKTIKERLEFVSDYERIAICEKLNNAKNQYIFDDKGETYVHFKRYYKRSLISVYTGTRKEISELRAFAEKHPRFVIKPIDSSCGDGVKIINSAKARDLDAFVTGLIRRFPGGVIVEELIIQDEKMSSLHPSSVNTVRISTVRMNDRVIILYPRLRIGQHGTLIDNASAGGILCVIDQDTGKVISAADKNGTHFDVHPDTGIPIIGFEIPRWDELKAIVNKLAQVVPSNRYTDWDMALGKEGWIMVEGNARAQFGWQYSLQKGFSSEIDSIFEELKISR